MSVRVALKIGYIGTNYYGFQIQPDVPTVEAEIFRALEELNIIKSRRDAHFSYAGRTDRGVHARSQVISFDATREISPRMLNSVLPDDIFAYAVAYPPQKFNARKDAISRTYRYFLLAPDLSVERMRSAASLFEGVHDFSNFADKEERRRSPIRHVLRLEVRRRGDFVVFDVRARSFLRKMVRKIVAALACIGRDEKDEAWLEDLLAVRVREFIKPVPPFGLVLWDVQYSRDVEFEEDAYALEKINEKLSEQFVFHRTLSAVFHEFLASIEK
ncbi:MAG: tRNA pseudouridine(38-40) synthase TruA [Candidatus Methanospirare jalkutatii]|nr:MAG: tRNA pseudouridine(38-40) synthase TruA [Candidatus Methanospirare jalkutatii]UYZ40238.1 MAG: tRNA pseudouridine(38-40) synthase TruA [Candidatus Methanospirare jalkutatii]